MGDLMTNGSYPVIDESSCGSLHGMIQAIERLLAFSNAETAVVPSHGQSQIAMISSIFPTRFVPSRGYVSGTVFVRMILAGLGLTEKTQIGSARSGCLNYDLHQSAEDADVWLVYENWRSPEGLDAHMRTEHLQAFFRQKRGLQGRS
jgi:hypothetical protein